MLLGKSGRRGLERASWALALIPSIIGALALLSWIPGVPVLKYVRPEWTAARVTVALAMGLSGAALWLAWHSSNGRRRTAERTLRESEENYRRLVEISRDALLVHRDFLVERVNPAALALFGAKANEELIGRSVFDLFHPDSHELERERAAKILAGEPAPSIELKIVRMDGSAREVEAAGSLCRGPLGAAVQVVLRDITESQRAAGDLRAAQEEISAIHDSAPAAFLVVDQDVRVRKMNEVAGRFTGRADSRSLGLRPGGVIGCLNALYDERGCGYGPGCGACPIRGAVLDGLNHQVPRKGFEARVPHATGERCLLVSTAPLALPGGAEVLICALDITERKRAELELQQQREWLRVTLASIGDAVLATDAAGRITLLNPAACHLTGWTEAEAQGRPARQVFRAIHARTRRPAADIVARALKEKAVVSLDGHVALVTRDGREVPIENSAAPIRDSAGGGGNVAGAVLVFHEVSEKSRAQEDLGPSEITSGWSWRGR